MRRPPLPWAARSPAGEEDDGAARIRRRLAPPFFCKNFFNHFFLNFLLIFSDEYFFYERKKILEIFLLSNFFLEIFSTLLFCLKCFLVSKIFLVFFLNFFNQKITKKFL